MTGTNIILLALTIGAILLQRLPQSHVLLQAKQVPSLLPKLKKAAFPTRIRQTT